MQQIKLEQFDGDGFLEKLQKAAGFLSQNPYCELILPKGEYVVGTDFSRRLMEDVLAGKYGDDPEKIIFRPYYHYDVLLCLNKARHVRVRGEGTSLLIDGFLEPVELTGCEDVELQGITIDYLRKPFSVGTTVGVGQNYIDVRFSKEQRVTGQTPAPRVVYFDEKRRCFSKTIMEPACAERREEDVVRYYADTVIDDMMGRQTVAIHTYHYRPAVFLHESKNIRLKNLAIHAQCGMGVLGHRCEDIFIEGLQIVPSAGMPISTNTDATHFTSCKGELTLKHCRFAGSEDDAINVHNYYYTLEAAGECSFRLRVNAPTFTHAQVVDYPDVLDELELVDSRTLKPVDVYQVVKCRQNTAMLCAEVTLDKPLSQNAVKNCLMLNKTRQPELRFIDNHVEYNLARCALIKTKCALIEGCTFQNSTGTAVHVSPEGWWHEGGATQKVVIKGNRFVHTGFGTYARHGNASAVCVEAQCDDKSELLHEHVSIISNVIEDDSDALYAVSVANTKEIEISGNTIHKKQTEPNPSEGSKTIVRM